YLDTAFDIFDPDVRYGNGEYQEVPASLTLPEPKNDEQRRALNTYLDSLEEATGKRPEIVFEARQRPEAEAGITAAPAAETRTTEPPQRPAEVIYSMPTRPLEQEAAAETTARENTDARQSTTAEHAEMSDAKAARRAARAEMRAEIEQS